MRNNLYIEKRFSTNKNKEYLAIYIDLGYGVKYINGWSLMDLCEVFNLELPPLREFYTSSPIGSKKLIYSFDI